MPSILVVTSGWPSPTAPEQSVFVASQVDALREAGLHVEVVHYVGRRSPWRYLQARTTVRKRTAGGRFDLVHAHFGQSALVVFPSRRPVVMSFHGTDLVGIPNRSGGYTVRGRALRVISRWAARRADAVVVPSQRLARELPDGVRCEIIPVGVDLDVFRPMDKSIARAELGLSPDRPLVLFAGVASRPVKRFELARRAVDILPAPGADLIALGGRKRPEVARLMSACDLLLVTSLHESGPLVVKEALACDLPVVSVDVGDVREWIDGLPGCVVCADDRPETIASGVRAVLANREAFHGRAVVGELSEAILVRRLVKLYQDVIRGTASSRQ